MRYNDPALSLIRRQAKGEKIQVRYDASDLSLNYVSDVENGIYIPVPALDQTYTKGLGLYQHNIIKKYVRDYLRSQVNSTTLVAGKARIQEIVAQEFKLTKKIYSRSKIACYNQESSTTIQKSKLKNSAAPNFSKSENKTENERLLLTPAVDNSFDADLEPVNQTQKNEKAPFYSDTEFDDENADSVSDSQYVSDEPDDDLDLSGWGADFNLNTKSGKEN